MRAMNQSGIHANFPLGSAPTFNLQAKCEGPEGKKSRQNQESTSVQVAWENARHIPTQFCRWRLRQSCCSTKPTSSSKHSQRPRRAPAARSPARPTSQPAVASAASAPCQSIPPGHAEARRLARKSTKPGRVESVPLVPVLADGSERIEVTGTAPPRCSRPSPICRHSGRILRPPSEPERTIGGGSRCCTRRVARRTQCSRRTRATRTSCITWRCQSQSVEEGKNRGSRI